MGNISYYDNIAADYDAILNEDKKNINIRNKVADTFISLVKGGKVLDFGGGTGLDFGWLLQHRYSITYCEPSVVMRRMAMERKAREFPGSSIFFLEGDLTDFSKWDVTSPFKQEMNAVLANFAVFNCIPDIEMLFAKLWLSLEPGGMVLALILDSSLIRRLRINLKGTILSLFSGDPVSFFVDYNGERQMVYIHSVKAIKKASGHKFKFIHHERMDGFGFSLIHLIRK
jgi:SAM-dependent methyltransferase